MSGFWTPDVGLPNLQSIHLKITAMKFLLSTLSFLALVSAQYSQDVCVVYTVLEYPEFTSSCYASLSSTTCVDILTTSYETINAPISTGEIEYTTLTTDIYTTVCPSPTSFTFGTLAYTVTEATTLTITDCPCTYSIPMSSSTTLPLPSSTGVVPAVTSSPSTPNPATTPFIASSSTTATSTSSAVSSSACQPLAPAYTRPGTATDCCQYHVIVSGDGCPAIEAAYNVTFSEFMALNLDLRSDCYNLDLGLAYCVKGVPNPTNCTDTPFPPNSTPASIGSGILANAPGLAIYNDSTEVWSFGMLETPSGFRGFSEINATTLPTDPIAYYEVSTNITNTTTSCSNFGYFYHINTGLCITVEQTNTTYPAYMNGSLTLAPCNTCSDTPPPDQMFCSYALGDFSPYVCMVFYGDTPPQGSFYAVTYGSGPQVFQASEQSLDLYNNADVTCVWLLF